MPHGYRSQRSCPGTSAERSCRSTSRFTVGAPNEDTIRAISQRKREPELIERYLGSVVPVGDNFYAALNSAVFSDGSFVYIQKGVRCSMELSSYFRINARNTGQFERTRIIAEAGSRATSRGAVAAWMRPGRCNKVSAPCLGKLISLAGVRHYPNRIKCALLSWHALAHALDAQNKEESPT